jgi:hypothetical protein
VKQAGSALPASREQIAQLTEAIDLRAIQLAALARQGTDRGLSIGRPDRDRRWRQVQLRRRAGPSCLGAAPTSSRNAWRVEAAGKNIDPSRRP